MNITAMVNSFLETARENFSLLRNAEKEYNNIIELVLQSLSDFENEAFLKDLCCDNDTLATILTASHETHLQVNIYYYYY